MLFFVSRFYLFLESVLAVELKIFTPESYQNFLSAGSEYQ